MRVRATETTHQKFHVTHFASAGMSTTVSMHASCKFIIFRQAQINVFLILLSYKSDADSIRERTLIGI